MKISVIDIGTNTVLMLVCEYDTVNRKLVKLGEYFEIPRVGKQLNSSGKIGEDEVKRLIRVLKSYVSHSNNFAVNKIFALATHAFRVATNSVQVIQDIKAETGIEIKVIPAELEGKLSFLGAISGSSHTGNASVIDIGGGSTEISFGSTTGVVDTLSRPIGVVTLNDRFLQSNSSDFQAFAHSEFTAEFRSFYNKFGEVTIALAGTPTTLACIKARLTVYDESLIEGSSLSISEIQEFIKSVANLTPADIAQKYKQVVSGREDLIKAGALLLLETMKLLKTETVFVSTKGLRYGAALSVFRGELQ